MAKHEFGIMMNTPRQSERYDEYDYYDSLELIYENLKQYDFLLIHKSYLINYRFVKIMSYDHVVLVDGTQIPISQAKREQIRKEFMKIEGR